MKGAAFNRRNVLLLGGAALGAALLPPRLLGEQPGEQPGQEHPGLDEALVSSDVVYLTPLHGDGRESTCQAEIWFVAEDRDVYVVTASDAWRARAVRNGLTRARIWVGDVGVWSDSDGAYRNLPAMEMQGEVVAEEAEHDRVLDVFGDKYSLEWVIWGPRFRNGVADGSRVMLHYRPV